MDSEFIPDQKHLDKLTVTLKTGKEQLSYNGELLNFSLLDFWSWSVSDILSNATRGRFAEFIVATAVHIEKIAVRDEWSAYDLETKEGIKIEVKSAAYIQTWFQRTLSKISFSTKAALSWDNFTNLQSTEKRRHADVYVFCLLHHNRKDNIDPLNLNQWEFYVLATKQLNDYKRSQHSITLKSLQNLTQAIGYEKLYETINEMNKLNKE